jgi:hypothetical protein
MLFLVPSLLSKTVSFADFLTVNPEGMQAFIAEVRDALPIGHVQLVVLDGINFVHDWAISLRHTVVFTFFVVGMFLKVNFSVLICTFRSFVLAVSRFIFIIRFLTVFFAIRFYCFEAIPIII